MPKTLNRGKSVRNGFVAIAFLFPDGQELLAHWLGRLSQAGRAQLGEESENNQAESHGERIAPQSLSGACTVPC